MVRDEKRHGTRIGQREENQKRRQVTAKMQRVSEVEQWGRIFRGKPRASSEKTA
jgi:hypothetical protein